MFAGWQRQLEASHTLGYLPQELSAEDKTRAIFDHLLAALYDMRFGQLGLDDGAGELDDAFDAIDDKTLGHDDEVNRLESVNTQASRTAGRNGSGHPAGRVRPGDAAPPTNIDVASTGPEIQLLAGATVAFDGRHGQAGLCHGTGRTGRPHRDG